MEAKTPDVTEITETLAARVFKPNEITVQSVTDLLRMTMEEVERLPLHGSEKADMVQNVLASEALHAFLPDKILNPLVAMMENDLLKPTIDAICAAARGDFRINAVVQAVGCCGSLMYKIAEARKTKK